MLRQEIYALDGTDKADHPYTVTEQNFTIETLQPQGDNRHAVFFTHAREAISYHYERNPADPRIQHALTLEVDIRQRPEVRRDRLRAPPAGRPPVCRGPEDADRNAHHLHRERRHQPHRHSRRLPHAAPGRNAHLRADRLQAGERRHTLQLR